MLEKRHITKEKKKELELELRDLIDVKRPAAIERVATAREMGDLKENSEYHSARDEQAKLVSRIEEIEYILKNAEIIKTHCSEIVELGCSAVVENTKTKEKKTFEIVGEEDSDVIAGKLSHKSPIGMALVGKKKGDEAIVETPKGNIVYKIKNIK